MFYMLLFNSLLFPIFQFIDFPYNLKQLQAKSIDLETTTMSQEKYNELFTPSELYISRRYASGVKIFLINALFLPLMPWAV